MLWFGALWSWLVYWGVSHCIVVLSVLSIILYCVVLRCIVVYSGVYVCIAVCFGVCEWCDEVHWCGLWRSVLYCGVVW